MSQKVVVVSLDEAEFVLRRVCVGLNFLDCDKNVSATVDGTELILSREGILYEGHYVSPTEELTMELVAEISSDLSAIEVFIDEKSDGVDFDSVVLASEKVNFLEVAEEFLETSSNQKEFKAVLDAMKQHLKYGLNTKVSFKDLEVICHCGECSGFERVDASYAFKNGYATVRISTDEKKKYAIKSVAILSSNLVDTFILFR